MLSDNISRTNNNNNNKQNVPQCSIQIPNTRSKVIYITQGSSIV